jgi:threonine aldolase
LRQFRSILRQAARSLDKKNIELANERHQKHLLEQQIEELKPKKKVKVVPSPNSRFVRLEQIQKAQKKAIARAAQITHSRARDILEEEDLGLF